MYIDTGTIDSSDIGKINEILSIYQYNPDHSILLVFIFFPFPSFQFFFIAGSRLFLTRIQGSYNDTIADKMIIQNQLYFYFCF
jgi:hypothetical protein